MLYEVITKIYVALGKNKQALAELNRLIEKFPDEARYYGYIADYYFYQKDLENARVFYQKVLEKDTKNGLAYFSLGNVELIANDTTKFEDYYSKALRNEYLPFDTKFQRFRITSYNVCYTKLLRLFRLTSISKQKY